MMEAESIILILFGVCVGGKPTHHDKVQNGSNTCSNATSRGGCNIISIEAD